MYDGTNDRRGTPEPVRFTVQTGQRTTATITNDTVAEWSPDDELAHAVESDTRAFAVD